MKSFLSKKTKGFTLIETVCYFALISFVIVSVISFHFFYKQKVRRYLNKITTYHKIQKFIDISESSLLELKAKHPGALVECKKAHVSITTGSEERFSLSKEDRYLKITWEEQGQTKEQRILCDALDIEFLAKSLQPKEPLRIKNMDALDITFQLEKNESFIITVPLI